MKSMRNRFIVVILAALAIALSAVEVRACGTVVYVNKDNFCPGAGTSVSPYCSIQNALNAAAPGVDIRIRKAASSYHQRLATAPRGRSAEHYP
jgi:hypothetical protein